VINGTVLIVDDEIAIVDALRHQLQRERFEVLHSASAAEALEMIALESRISLVVLDVGLPDQLGTRIFPSIRAVRNDIPVLFLTARNDEVDRIIGLELGADDYITKPFSPREVVVRIKNILRRTGISGESSIERVPQTVFTVEHEQKRIFLNGISLDLARYEYLLLKLLLSRPGKVFSRDEILSRVWESPEMSLERTVDTHIKTIRAKIRAVDPEKEYISTHRGFGYSIVEKK